MKFWVRYCLERQRRTCEGLIMKLGTHSLSCGVEQWRI